jgi:hypothetical protein
MMVLFSGRVYAPHLFSSIVTTTSVAVAAPAIGGIAASVYWHIPTDPYASGRRGGRRGVSRGGGERNCRESEDDYGQDEESECESFQHDVLLWL